MSRRRWMPSVFQFAFVVVSALAVAACGGSSSGGSGSNTEVEGAAVVSGIVTDPPIEGAAVRLVDAQGDALTRITVSDRAGRFSFELPGTSDLTGARVVVVGGKDVKTGQDFRGLTLTAEIAEGVETFVTPLTTLASAYRREGGAAADLAVLLGLSESDLMADPANSAVAQRASLLITELMVALKGVDQADELIAEALELVGLGASGEADFIAVTQQLEASDRTPGTSDRLLSSLVARIGGLNERVTESPTTAQGIVETFNLINLEFGVGQYFVSNLGLSETEPLRDNAEKVAGAIWHAIGKRGVPSDSPALLNMVRFVLQDNMIESSDLEADGFEVSDLSGSAAVLNQLADQNFIDVAQPLAIGEELGGGNEARVGYFFNSNVSPYYRSAQLFDGVYDDAVLDPLYVQVAAGQASAGLIETADLTVSAFVFGAVDRASGYRAIALALLAKGEANLAVDYLKKSREVYLDYLSAKSTLGGGLELNADDAGFFQSLSDDFKTAGNMAESIASFRPIQSYLDAQKGTYSTRYARLIYSMRKNIHDLFEGQSDGVATAVKAFQEAVYGLGANGTDENCHSVRIGLLADVTDFAVRLDDRGALNKSLDSFKQSFENACDVPWASRIANRFSYGFGYAGRAVEFRELIEQKVRPESEAFASSALAGLVLFDALGLAESGRVDEAIQIVVSSTDDIEAQIQALTFDGLVRRNYLAGELFERGALLAAKQVLDHAYELSLSGAYYDQVGSPSFFVSRGCGELAEYYKTWVSVDLARAKMAQCRDTVVAKLDRVATEEQFSTYAALIPKYKAVDLDDQLLPLVDRYRDLIPVLASAENRLSKSLVAAKLYAEAHAHDSAHLLLDAAWGMADRLVGMAVTDEERESAVDGYIQVGRYHAEVAEQMRSVFPADDEALAQRVRDIRAAVQTQLMGDHKATTYIERLNSPKTRDTLYQKVIAYLSQARAFAAAIELAQQTGPGVERNKRLAIVAETLNSYDDFPGTTVVRFDFDQDGLPDFYSPSSSDDERLRLKTSLDSDIDGDSIPDTSDITPYDFFQAI